MVTYDEIVKKLQSHGLNLLDNKDSYKGTNGVSNLMCSNGHTWTARISIVLSPKKIIRPSKGCPTCADNMQLEQALNVAKKQLQMYDGYTIIDSHINNNWTRPTRMYTILCDKGHTYNREGGHIVKSGCPKCTETTFVGQERVRAIFEQAFNEKFEKIKPGWLKNPNTNSNLELDGYCEALKIAFEYQGRQHFSDNTQFAGEYENQAKRDLIKEEICKNLGITLIKINQPRSYKEKEFTQSVINDCKAQGIDLEQKLQNKTVDFKHINDSNTALGNLSKFKEYVEQTTNKLLSQKMSTLEDEFEFECGNGHYFKMNGLKFKGIINQTNNMREIPCSTCFEIAQPQRAREQISIQTCQHLAQNLGFKLFSTEYKNVNTVLNWQCDQGHSFSKTFRQMERNQTGSFCPTCVEQKIDTSYLIKKLDSKTEYSLSTKNSSGQKLDINWLHKFLDGSECEVMGDKYLGMDIKHDFTCSKGHSFSSTISNLKDRKSRGSHFCAFCGTPKLITIDTCQEFAKTHNMQCLETEYKNVNTFMKWVCENGHHFEKTWRQFDRNRTGKYCPTCK
jgi:hypothetical protein